MYLILNEKPFISISGEGGFFPQGSICTFLRLQGCNFYPRCCKYCDTPQAQSFEGGIAYSIDGLINQITTKQVLITGGEPLSQVRKVLQLIKALLMARHEVQIETNGSILLPITKGYENVGWVIDRKGPSSGVSMIKETPDPTNDFYHWIENNVIFKYIVAGKNSEYYEKDRAFVELDMQELDEAGYKGNFLISPMDAGIDTAGALFFYPQKFWDRVIISLQLHKILGLI